MLSFDLMQESCKSLRHSYHRHSLMKSLKSQMGCSNKNYSWPLSIVFQIHANESPVIMPMNLMVEVADSVLFSRGFMLKTL